MSLVGRESEVGVVLELLVAGRSAPAAVVLDGEAGIGKTTLFEAALAAAREQGFAVFSCRPAEADQVAAERATRRPRRRSSSACRRSRER
jgi:MoxR-like ATPase